ncbi:ATP-binding protein [Luteolibacter marinus]|uniref:ATP-binding protein n=1 Tax=Luteolibacter marinus TaxID=2776705 RepID=UPI001866DA0D|nr:ATP-binding protein [Luteolibacter marinus]
MNRLEIDLRLDAGAWELARWELYDGGSRAGFAGGPQSGMPRHQRLRDSAGWKAVLLAALRTKLGPEPGRWLIEDHHDAKIARTVAMQLYQGGRVAWIKRLFGADLDGWSDDAMLATVTGRIGRLLTFDNPGSAAGGRIVRIFPADHPERFGPDRIDVTINGAPAAERAIRDSEALIAKALGLPPLDRAAGTAALFGREEELAALSRLLESRAGLVQVTGPGGRGKTAFVRDWLRALPEPALPVFEFSLYRQAHAGFRHQALSPLIAALDAFLGLPAAPALPALARVRRWMEKLGRRPALLFLDGLEVLLDPATGESVPESYPEILALLRGFQGHPEAGLIVTTRVPLRFPKWSPGEIQLPPLSSSAVASILAGRGLRVEGELLHRAITFTEGSPLFAHLLAGLAGKACPADPADGLHRVLDACQSRPRATLPELVSGPADSPAHAMLRRHEIAIAGTAAEALLRVCSVFQGDPDPVALKALLESHRLAGSPDLRVPPASSAAWEQVAAELIRSGLASGSGFDLKLHPIIHNHFAVSLQDRDARLWKSLHLALYDHYRLSVLEHRPRDPADLTQLLHAVIHGCLAGQASRVHREVSFERFSHGYMLYPLFSLGAAHEVGAGMEAVRLSLREEGNEGIGLEETCALDVVEALGQISLMRFDRAERLLEQSHASGYAQALRGDDSQLASVQVFTLCHQLALYRLRGKLAPARRAGRKLIWLALRKRSLLESHLASINRDEARVMGEFVAAQVAMTFLDSGRTAVAGRIFSRHLRERRSGGFPGQRLLPDLAGRQHGEFLIATGQASRVIEAIESGDLGDSPVPHAFGNTAPYLLGLASLQAAFAAAESKERGELFGRAKRSLDEACLDAADRLQPQFELPARLARAEWAIAARDELAAMTDLRHVAATADHLGFETLGIRAGLLSLVAAEAFGFAPDDGGNAIGRLKASGWRHPDVAPFLGRRGARHVGELARRRFD